MQTTLAAAILRLFSTLSRALVQNKFLVMKPRRAQIRIRGPPDNASRGPLSHERFLLDKFATETSLRSTRARDICGNNFSRLIDPEEVENRNSPFRLTGNFVEPPHPPTSCAHFRAFSHVDLNLSNVLTRMR